MGMHDPMHCKPVASEGSLSHVDANTPLGVQLSQGNDAVGGHVLQRCTAAEARHLTAACWQVTSADTKPNHAKQDANAQV